jgi:hypothetical protein
MALVIAIYCRINTALCFALKFVWLIVTLLCKTSYMFSCNKSKVLLNYFEKMCIQKLRQALHSHQVLCDLNPRNGHLILAKNCMFYLCPLIQMVR